METGKEISDGDPLPEGEDAVPESVSLDDARFFVLMDRLARRDAEVRSPEQLDGRISPGEKPRTIEVAGHEVAVPQDAKARAWPLDTRPGLLVEAVDPAPKGTWVWIAGAATREINELLRTLDAS